MTAAAPPQIPLIEEFLQAMSADRGLARNSLDAYRRDLEAAASRLVATGSTIDGVVPRICAAYWLVGIPTDWHRGLLQGG